MASTTRSTILVTLLTLAGTVLGFGRESFIAYFFGANGVTDTFYVASVIPDMLAGWISYALTNSLIPILKEEMSKSSKSAEKLIGVVLIHSTIALILIAFFGYFFKSQLIGLLAPNFSLDEKQIGIHLLNVMLWSVIFTGLSGVFWGIHNAYGNFTYPAIVGIVYNIILLLTTVFLGRLLGIEALAYGFLAGVMGRFFVQLLPLVKKRQLRWPKVLWHRSMIPIIRSVIPIFASAGVGAFNQIVDRILASGLPPGRISDLNYASKVGLLPVTIFAASLATTLYTRIVKNRIDGDEKALEYSLARGLTWITFLSIVVTSGFLLYGTNIVSILYKHGHFNFGDVVITGHLLKIYGGFSLFYLYAPILTNLFYAYRYNRYVMGTSILAVFVNVLASIVLVRILGVSGLVVSNGLSQCVTVLVLLFLVVTRMKINLSVLLKSVIKDALPPGILFAFGATLALVFWNLPESAFLYLIVLRGIIALLLGILMIELHSWRYPENAVSYVTRSTNARIYQYVIYRIWSATTR